MKKSFLILPAMIALLSFSYANNDRINEVSSDGLLLAQQDPPQIPSLIGIGKLDPLAILNSKTLPNSIGESFGLSLTDKMSSVGATIGTAVVGATSGLGGLGGVGGLGGFGQTSSTGASTQGSH